MIIDHNFSDFQTVEFIQERFYCRNGGYLTFHLHQTLQLKIFRNPICCSNVWVCFLLIGFLLPVNHFRLKLMGVG